jgi:membrane associated rhomboid family serine protease
MFAEAPAAPDADLFTLRVLERLDRGWNARRVLIGAMGALGGVIGAYEILGSGATGHLFMMFGQANDFLARHVAASVSDALAPGGIYVDVQAIWLAGALAIVAAGFGLARLVREI